ncbi:hypothetical protein PQE70_gp196 [Bacillus phage vB_BanS_Nate]|uniref:Uncharacterized protein n=1 Tax=Bacillus phage vB_BanS_Nate TaxID=2894788 RepID=A0AAE8YY31_9CAUD|nr:hypothetical protein PQE70_gp196 [Bacillus phage vB_BanS_Nate]UGO51049.1 hypothetical protein NATE_196 [Bacillus phage vB_BanS_Nate]
MRYGVGDIVRRNTNRKMEYFIIVDVFLQFNKDTEFSFSVNDDATKYTGIQIYPIESEGQIMKFQGDMIEIVALTDEAQHAKIMEIVHEERERRNIKWEAEYMKTIREKINSGLALEWEGKNKKAEKVEVKPKKKRGRPKKLKDKDDVIEYHKLATVDDCLDALNDLSILHEMFGDESYIQLKEVVTNRLKELC